MSAIANPQIGLYGRVVKSPASGAGLRKAGVGSNPTAVSKFYTIFDFPPLPFHSNTNVLQLRWNNADLCYSLSLLCMYY